MDDAKDIIRRLVALDDVDVSQGKDQGTPCGLPSVPNIPGLPAGELPHAEMGVKPACKTGYIITIGGDLQ
jgi:hypothetical protein